INIFILHRICFELLHNIRKHKYETRQQFTEHVNLIVNNCITYNGFNSELTKTAQRMLGMSNKEINQVST
uniref:Bromo domain-containing protein n=1 Tax=Amphimedon queenslandica TaxID=400682 RepID=A0A1X7SQS7_AMPQE